MNSTLSQAKLGSCTAVEKGVRAVAHTVRPVGRHHRNVHVLELGEIVPAVDLAVAHAGESHAGGEGVPHVVALHQPTKEEEKQAA
jgi:hypothetical protein